MAPASGPHTSSIAQCLPSGIIYEILQHFSAPLLTAHLDRFPWYLAHICSSWRIEFISMRRNFWNEIIISLCESDRKGQGETLDVLNMFLEYNIGYPFSFELDARGARESPYFSPIFDKIISESARWKRVTLGLGIADIPALYHVKGKLECLESVEFLLEEDIDYTISEAFTDLFMFAPHFTRMDICLLAWNFNWSIMTVLHLNLIQREEVARLPLILSQTMRMETLSIHLFCESGTSFPSHELITLPNLTVLDTGYIFLLQIVTTPSLKELHLGIKWGDEADPPPTVAGIVKSFISRSQCRIQILALEALDAALVIEILSHAPDIEVLYLGEIAGTSNVFWWLNEMHRVQTPKLTRLQSLNIDYFQCPEDERDELSEFVAWRIEDAGFIVEKLQKIDLGSQMEDEDEEAEAQMRKLFHELYDIQLSANGDKPKIEGCHDRSSDPYVCSKFR